MQDLLKDDVCTHRCVDDARDAEKHKGEDHWSDEPYEKIRTPNLHIIAMTVQLPSRTASLSQACGTSDQPGWFPKYRHSIATRMNTKVTMIETLVLNSAIRYIRGAKILTRHKSDCGELRA